MIAGFRKAIAWTRDDLNSPLCVSDCRLISFFFVGFPEDTRFLSAFAEEITMAFIDFSRIFSLTRAMKCWMHASILDKEFSSVVSRCWPFVSYMNLDSSRIPISHTILSIIFQLHT